MTLKGGTSQACAACRYQRRKCAADCQLAPYFPAEQPKMFENAHRLFGVSNILKILKHLNPTQKMEAMRSIIYQAEMRSRFPVHGCQGIICQLRYQIQAVEEELHAVHTQLAIYRQHEISTTINDSTSHLQLGMAPPSNAAALTLFHQDTPQQQYNDVAALPVGVHQSYLNNNGNVGYNSLGYVEAKENNGVNSVWVQQGFSNGNGNNSMGMQSQLMGSQALNIQQEATQVYDEMHPFFDTIDDRQSYIDSKEAYESSSESSLKDTTQSIEHVAENELKSAAACFSLTSVN